MKKRCVMLSFLFSMIASVWFSLNLSTNKGNWLNESRAKELHNLAQQFTRHLLNSDEQAALAMMNDNMRQTMDGKILSSWAQLSLLVDAFVKTGNYLGFSSQGYDILEMELIFKKGTVVQRLVFDADNRIAGLFFQNRSFVSKSSKSESLSADLMETEEVVDAGQGTL